MTKQDFINLGGKEWNNHGKERVYINKAIYEEHFFPAAAIIEKWNKIYFDCEKNALIRQYRNKKPKIEIQY